MSINVKKIKKLIFGFKIIVLSPVSALHETPAGVLEAGCDEMTEWAELSNFQRGRLLGHGYSCNVEVKIIIFCYKISKNCCFR